MNDDLAVQWHLAACEQLEAQVESRAFFLTVRVEPGQAERGSPTTPSEVDSRTWEAVAERVERWLGGLDPDGVAEGDVPKLEVRADDTLIELSAAPKKKSRRKSDPLIGNPYPGIATFPGFFSSGPPPDPFDTDS